jgi:predicted HicB family RNase H-like nuclease
MSESKGARSRYTLRIPASLKHKIEALAKAAGLTVNDYIVRELDRRAPK